MMEAKPKVETTGLMQFPLSGVELSSRSRELIQKQAKLTYFSDNRIIYLQEDLADKFFIVMSGYVRLSYILENGTSILYGIVPPGQSFGELGVFDRSVYLDTASAIGSISVLSIRADLFHTRCVGDEELRSALSALIAERYKTYIDITKSLYLSNLSARLAMSLLRLARTFDQKMDIGGRRCFYLGPMVTQADLGAMARGARGNVNRLLKRWERENLIRLQERRIILMDPEGLEMLTLGGGDDV